MAKYYAAEEMQEILWDFIKQYKNLGEAARALDVSLAYLYQYAAGSKRHSFPSAQIAAKLGFHKTTAYIGPNTYSLPYFEPTERKPDEPSRLAKPANPAAFRPTNGRNGRG
jgi:hypothetical protein